MKTAHFLFTMIGCAVLTQGVGYADPSSATSAQPPFGNPNTTVSDHQLVSSPSAGTARGGAVENKTVNNRVVHPQGAVSLTRPSPRNAPNRNPSPAVIGGPGNSTKITAAINGSSMNRKR
jgi:hypothetical protein